MLADGRTRAIGVSNCGRQHLENLMRQTDVVPAVNQVELHPFFTQQPLREFPSGAWPCHAGVVVARRRLCCLC
jgi:diketogulonate reductase-like aldo/keto reductase